MKVMHRRHTVIIILIIIIILINISIIMTIIWSLVCPFGRFLRQVEVWVGGCRTAIKKDFPNSFELLLEGLKRSLRRRAFQVMMVMMMMESVVVIMVQFSVKI